MSVVDFLSEHPFYIPFILFNVWLVYRLIKEVMKDDDNSTDDDDEGGVKIDDPVLDLPPGVSLPTDSPKVEA